MMAYAPDPGEGSDLSPILWIVVALLALVWLNALTILMTVYS